ncbi:MAG: helix-turn-helix domain-containing protein [Proteobacteria bacterium]|nr:helix-turn-helix domain-containing protein [Pseudomonadota bacterium]
MTLLDPEILTLEDVSALLRCARDTVRRIPRERLPVYRPGKRNLYLREDLIRFIRSCRVERPDIDTLISELSRDVVGLRPDGVRGRPRRRTS